VRRLIKEMNQRAQNLERQITEMRRRMDRARNIVQQMIDQINDNIDQRAENREDPVAEIRREQEKCPRCTSRLAIFCYPSLNFFEHRKRI
jgi:pantothenate synthetase